MSSDLSQKCKTKYMTFVNLQGGSFLPKARLTSHGDFQALGVELGKAGSILREKIWSQMVLPLHMARMKEAPGRQSLSGHTLTFTESL